MLVLTRLVNDAIDIGGNIKIRILAIHGKRVKIGIEAPREVIVTRSEITNRIQESMPLAPEQREPVAAVA